MRWWLSLLLCSALSAQELTVEVSAPDEVEFGHSFSLVVKISWEDGWQLEPFRVEQFAPLKVRELNSEFHGSSGRNERKLRCQAFAFERDRLTVPAVTVVARSIEDGAEQRATSQERSLRVISSLEADDSGEMELPELPPERSERGWLFDFGVIAAIALLPVVVLGVVLLIRRRRKQKLEPAELPADQAVMRALARMRAEEPDDLDVQREEAIEAAAALRRYVEERFELNRAGQTDEEFLAAEDTADVLEAEQRELLTEFLMACDLLKYARRAPARVEREQLLLSLESFVEETRSG